MTRAHLTRSLLLLMGIVVAIALAVASWFYKDWISTVSAPLLKKTRAAVNETCLPWAGELARRVQVLSFR